MMLPKNDPKLMNGSLTLISYNSPQGSFSRNMVNKAREGFPVKSWVSSHLTPLNSSS